MISVFLLIGFAQMHWKAPYTVVDPPTNVANLVHRLGKETSGVFVDRDLLTFISTGQNSTLQLPDWFTTKAKRDEADNAWVVQLRMPAWDRSFFSYRTLLGAEKTNHEFAGRHAPRPPVIATSLVGSIQIIPFASKALGETRDVTVYIPPRAGLKVDTVYMADGQSCEDFAKVLEPLILAKKIAPTAIIGLNHGAYLGKYRPDFSDYDFAKDFRAREYLKAADPDRFEQYVHFTVDEVIPWAEAKFNLQTGRSHRMLFGFSNGAAFTLMAAADRPEAFGSALACSIAAFDRPDLTKSIAGKAMPEMFLASGTLESFIENTSDAADILKQAHYKIHFDKYVSGHEELMWKMALVKCLPKIFPAPRAERSTQ